MIAAKARSAAWFDALGRIPKTRPDGAPVRDPVPPLDGSPRRVQLSQSSLVVLLLSCLVLVVPLAAASPPDSLWIAGIYDAADSDDVVSAAIFGQEGPGGDRTLAEAPLLSIARDNPATIRAAIPAGAPASARKTRAPPRSS